MKFSASARVIPILLLCGCLSNLNTDSATETTNGTGKISGRLVTSSGRPAAHAALKIYRTEYIPSFVDIDPMSSTNENGEYSLSLSVAGSYNIVAENPDRKKAFIPGIRLDTFNFRTDTVKPTGSVIGKTYLPLQSDTNQVRVIIYIPGTGFITLPDIGGSFSISGIPEGSYRIFFNPLIQDYYVKIKDIHISAGATLDLGTVIIYGKDVTGLPTAKAGPDDTVSINDTIRLHGTGYDYLGFDVALEWDIGNKGDFTENTTGDTSFIAPAKAKDVPCILRVSDIDGNRVTDTIVITVLKDAPAIIIPADTILDYSTLVTFPIRISQRFGSMKLEIDSANTGNFRQIADGITAKDTIIKHAFFTSSPAWDSVKVRVTDDDGNEIVTGCKVDIRPGSLDITTIDSTTDAIAVHYEKTREPDFKEYRIYRSKTKSVDSSSELWAIVAGSGETIFTSKPNYAWNPRYYRAYQVDTEGAFSKGGAIVYGCIINSPPSIPLVLYPANDRDTIWSDDTLRWSTSLDLNDHAITYDVSLNYNNAGYSLFAAGITDTFIKLRGFDSLYAVVRIIARDSAGANSAWSSEKSFAIKWAGPRGMKLIPSGSFIDENGNRAYVSKYFWMDSTEVTGKEYKRLMGGKHPEWPRRYFYETEITTETRPAENIGFMSAIIFCNEKSKVIGLDTVYSYNETPEYNLVCHWDRQGYRLPTEDEWELAAKGGLQYQYGTNDGIISCLKANYRDCKILKTIEVASYPPNPYGIYDLAGNTAELCWDVFNADDCTIDCERANDRVDYHGPAGQFWENSSNGIRVVRGGSWIDSAEVVRSHSRSHDNDGIYNGLRTVLPLR
jgi:formylglycine-generating enzyme required for sulfatase activity